LNFYQHHIGDYRSHTSHLSNEEDLAYRRLLEMYYDSECCIPLDTHWVARRLRVDSQIIQVVLNDFFVLAEDGWHSTRCDTEIADYQRLLQKNRTNGKKGGRPKSLITKGNNPVGLVSVKPGMPVATHSEGNHEPETMNHEPIKKTVRAARFTLPDWINRDHWDAWHSSAKRKKATAEQKQAAIDKLSEWRLQGLDFAGALENSAVGGWGGLFLPDRPAATQFRPSHSKYAGAAAVMYGDIDHTTEVF
jgi:uncharacterized protein YdaU (DUF1376 family)